MNTPQDIDSIIFEYLDGLLSPSARHAFEKEVENNPSLKNRLHELQQMHVLIKSNVLEQPSKNFTQVVMANLSGKSFYEQLSIRNNLLLLFGIMLVTGLCAFFVSNGFFDSTTTLDINSITPVNDYIEKYSDRAIPVFNIDGKMMINAIIVLNLALAFLILDRAVLRPLFQKRMNTDY